MKIAEIFYKLGKRLRKKKGKVTDPRIEKSYFPSNGIEDVSENRIFFSDSPVIESERTEGDELNRLEPIANKKEKVTDPRIEKNYSPSDEVKDVRENRESPTISVGISNNTVKNSEPSPSKPTFLIKYEWILSKLAKAGNLHYPEKFLKILQRNYSNEFEGSLDFKKVKNKSIQARLLTKTVSEYLSFESESTNSVERYFSNLYPDYIIKVFRVNCPARYESAWIDEGIIYINEGHPAHKHAGRQYEYYHDVVSVVIAIVRYTNKTRKDSFLNQGFENMATSLTKKERDILFKRYFIENPHSLKTIGQHYAVTRERIRQIETKSLTRLRENGLHIAFLYELFKLGLPNILQMEQLAVINRSLGITSGNPFSLIKITSKIIKQIRENAGDFKFYFIGDKFIYLRYYNYPDISRLSTEKWIDKTEIPKEEFKDYLINEEFCFFTEDELEILHGYFSEQHKQYSGRGPLLKDVIIQSLRLIDCPAHYSDIAEKVREIGGEKYRDCSPSSIHGALSLYNEFVWVGRKGVYGLKERGLAPPNKSLEDQIYSILKNSAKPLSKESIATELSKKRPYFSETSLNFILGTSDRIIKNQNNLYRIPNKDDIEVRIVKKVQTDKMSNAMEEVFREWEKQNN